MTSQSLLNKLPFDIKYLLLEEWIDDNDLKEYNVGSKSNSNAEIYEAYHFRIKRKIELNKDNIKFFFNNKIKLTNIEINNQCKLINLYINEYGDIIEKMEIPDVIRLNYYLEKISEKCINLTYLKSHYSYNVKYSPLNKCHNLIDLDISFYSSKLCGDNFIQSVAENCHKLEKISFVSLICSDESIIKLARNLHNLKSLKLCMPDRISSDNLKIFAENSPNLTYLNLNRSFGLSIDLIPFFLEKCPKLETIKFSGINFEDEPMINLDQNYLSLTNLNIGVNNNLNDSFIIDITKKCPNIQHLEVEYCENLTKDSIIAIFKNCYNLNNLNLEGIHLGDFSKEMIETMEINCTKLISINASNLDIDVGTFLEKITKKCHLLKDLDLSYNKFTDDELISISKNISNVEELRFIGLDITDIGLTAMVEKSPKLKNLIITGENVTDIGLIAVAENCPKLEILIINNSDISDIGLIAISENCRNLIHFQINGFKITDNGLKAIVENSPKIKKLYFYDTNLGDDVLIAIAENCPNLEILIFNSDHTPTEIINLINEKCTKLKNIHMMPRSLN